MSLSDTIWPFLMALRNQVDSTFSMSGDLPWAAFLTGELLGLSGKRYFSFWRRTLETVLHRLVRLSVLGPREIPAAAYLRSTPHIFPIAVCSTPGWFSANLHISRRSLLLSVFLGLDLQGWSTFV